MQTLLSVRYSNPEIKALMDDAEKLDTIRNMLLEGYKNAGENFKAQKDDAAAKKSVDSRKEKIVNKSKTIYNEDETLKMIWGNSKSTPVGTTWLKPTKKESL